MMGPLLEGRRGLPMTQCAGQVLGILNSRTPVSEEKKKPTKTN